MPYSARVNTITLAFNVLFNEKEKLFASRMVSGSMHPFRPSAELRFCGSPVDGLQLIVLQAVQPLVAPTVIYSVHDGDIVL